MSRKLLKLSYSWLDESDTHFVTCCVCDGENEQEIKNSFELNGKEFSIKYCRADDLIYLSPQPGKKYQNALYNHPTYYQGVDDMYGLLIEDKKSEAIAKLRIGEIRKYAPKATSILEIGCAYGHLLSEALSNSFLSVKGIEFSDKAVEICAKKGLDVVSADANLLGYKGGQKYDIVASYSTLEHLENPNEFLMAIKNFLKPTGKLILRVPDTDSVLGPPFSLLDHLWHFTRDSIEKILKKNGFIIEDIFESGTFYARNGKILKNMTIIAFLKI